MESKFQTILESFINGNITWVKDQVKKLSKKNRKELYNYVSETYPQEKQFFFKLI